MDRSSSDGGVQFTRDVRKASRYRFSKDFPRPEYGFQIDTRLRVAIRFYPDHFAPLMAPSAIVPGFSAEDTVGGK
jgi:hypothetical protein